MNVGKKGIKYIFFIAVQYISTLVSGIRIFFLAKFLGPMLYGYWGNIKLLHDYLIFYPLGIQHAMNKEIAINSDDKSDQVKIFHSSLINFLYLTVGFTLVLLILYFCDVFKLYDESFNNYIIIIAVVIVLENFKRLNESLYRSLELINRISIVRSVGSVTLLILTITIVPHFKIIGLLFSMMISLIVSNSIFLYKFPISLKITGFKLSKKNFKLQLLGLFLMIFNILNIILYSSDRLFIKIFYSVQSMGFYSFAFSIASFIFIAFSSLSYLFYPKLLNAYKMSNTEYMEKYEKNVYVIYTFSITIVILLFFCFSPLLKILLPQFNESKNILLLIIVGQMFISSTFTYSAYLIANDRNFILIVISGTCVLLSFILNAIIALLQIDYFYLAVMTLVTGVVYYFLFIMVISIINKKLFRMKTVVLRFLSNFYVIGILILYLTCKSDIVFYIGILGYLCINFKVIMQIFSQLRISDGKKIL